MKLSFQKTHSPHRPCEFNDSPHSFKRLLLFEHSFPPQSLSIGSNNKISLLSKNTYFSICNRYTANTWIHWLNQSQIFVVCQIYGSRFVLNPEILWCEERKIEYVYIATRNYKQSLLSENKLSYCPFHLDNCIFIVLDIPETILTNLPNLQPSRLMSSHNKQLQILSMKKSEIRKVGIHITDCQSRDFTLILSWV